MVLLGARGRLSFLGKKDGHPRRNDRRNSPDAGGRSPAGPGDCDDRCGACLDQGDLGDISDTGHGQHVGRVDGGNQIAN